MTMSTEAERILLTESISDRIAERISEVEGEIIEMADENNQSVIATSLQYLIGRTVYLEMFLRATLEMEAGNLSLEEAFHVTPNKKTSKE